MNQKPKSYKPWWMIATIFTALCIVIMVYSFIIKIVHAHRYGGQEQLDWEVIASNLFVLVLIVGFIFVLLRKPRVGGVIIIAFAVLDMIVYLMPYYHAPAAAALHIPLLAAGIFYVIYWHKNVRQNKPDI